MNIEKLINSICEFEDLDSIAISVASEDQLRYIFTNMISPMNSSTQLLVSCLREYDNLRIVAAIIGMTTIQLKHILINQIN